MLQRTLISLVGALGISVGLSMGLAQAVEPAPETVYGSQLMTQKDRSEHRALMRAARTPEEKARIRTELHERMKVRAQQLGVALPDTPPAAGGGMGPGLGGGRNR